MTNFKNKTTASVIALFLMLSMVTSLVLPVARAQSADEKVTYCFIGANPNPVGVGQEVLLHFGITDPLQGLHSTLA